MTISGRGRPASVDVDTQQHVVLTAESQSNGPNPGIQAVTRRGLNQGRAFFFDFFLFESKTSFPQGIPYSDASTDLQSYAVTGDNSNSSSSTTSSSMGIIVSTGVAGNGATSNHCSSHCSLNAMVICQQCGAFTHEDCQKQKLCVSCVIRWMDKKRQFSLV